MGMIHLLLKIDADEFFLYSILTLGAFAIAFWILKRSRNHKKNTKTPSVFHKTKQDKEFMKSICASLWECYPEKKIRSLHQNQNPQILNSFSLGDIISFCRAAVLFFSEDKFNRKKVIERLIIGGIPHWLINDLYEGAKNSYPGPYCPYEK